MIILTASLSIVWAFMVGWLLLGPGPWFAGQLLIFIILLAGYRVRQLRATRAPERPGPKAEWID